MKTIYHEYLSLILLIKICKRICFYPKFKFFPRKIYFCFYRFFDSTVKLGFTLSFISTKEAIISNTVYGNRFNHSIYL